MVERKPRKTMKMKMKMTTHEQQAQTEMGVVNTESAVDF